MFRWRENKRWRRREAGRHKESEQVSSGFRPLFPLIDFLCSFLLPTLLILTYSSSQLALIVSPSLLSSSLDVTQSLPRASSLYTFSLSSHPFRALPLSLPSTVYSPSVLASFSLCPLVCQEPLSLHVHFRFSPSIQCLLSVSAILRFTLSSSLFLSPSI